MMVRLSPKAVDAICEVLLQVMTRPFFQVVDGFYSKPMDVRQRALSMKYREPEDIIGWRTPIWHPRGIRTLIEKTFRIQIEHWENARSGVESSNGVFFSAFSAGPRGERVKVHFDEPSDWMSLLIYLTPDAPYDTGTSFWQHRKTGLIAKPTKLDSSKLGLRRTELEAFIERDGWKRNCWIEVDRVGNRFNRAVMFPAGRLHSATKHFGLNLNSGRLYQSFHFSVSAGHRKVPNRF